MKELLRDFEETTQEQIELIASFSQEQLNTVPFEGSWTAAQVAEHVFKSQVGVPEVLQGSTRPTTRQPDENIEMLKSVFLNYSIKMKSPASIVPSNERLEKALLVNALKNTRADITNLIATLDLTEICTSFPFPETGELTRLEWIHFTIYHTRRHTQQLKHIKASL